MTDAQINVRAGFVHKEWDGADGRLGSANSALSHTQKAPGLCIKQETSIY